MAPYVTHKLLIFCAIVTHINDNCKHIKFEVSLHLAYCAARRRGVALRPRAAPAHLGVAETGLNKTD